VELHSRAGGGAEVGISLFIHSRGARGAPHPRAAGARGVSESGMEESGDQDPHSLAAENVLVDRAGNLAEEPEATRGAPSSAEGHIPCRLRGRARDAAAPRRRCSRAHRPWGVSAWSEGGHLRRMRAAQQVPRGVARVSSSS